MTAEERLLIEMSDVLSLELTCKECGVRVGISARKQGHRLPSKCAGCGADFFSAEGTLHTAVRSLFNLSNGEALMSAPFTLQLVVDKPKD